MTLYRLTGVLVFVGAAFAGSAGWAQTAPDMRAAAVLAANCSNCHGTAGVSPGAVPGLAGKPKDFIVQQMAAFRNGQRSATIMHQLAKGYTEQQTELMAEYFSRQAAK